MQAFWIILTGSLVATSCGLLGNYLVLRRMAMMGDAISHAVLPGIVLAFFLTGTRDAMAMLIGAGVLGLLTTFIIDFLHKRGKLQADASIGVTFTSLFAIGIILISAFAGQVDLDQECVLYGEIAYVPIDLWILDGGTIMGPRAVYISGGVLLLVLTLIFVGYKELYLTTFDPVYAGVVGISTSLWQALLMGGVSMTTVASFESVGAILVVAFLIAPAATAYLLTHSFRNMLWITVLLAIITSAGGYYLAVAINGSIAGAMATVAGIIFMLVFLFAPPSGLIWRLNGPKTEQPEELSAS